MPSERSDLTGIATILFAASLFGTLGLLSRLAYDRGLAPFAFVTWRATVGAIGLWTAIVLLRARRRPFVRWSDMGARAQRALVVAVLVGTLLNLAVFLAFERTTIALALLGFYLYPALVAVGSVALGRERLDSTKLLALLLALGGMVAVVLGGITGGQPLVVDPLGIGAALTAAACQAVFVLISRDYASLPTEQAMGTILAGTSLTAAVVTTLTVGAGQILAPFADPALLGLMLVVGIFAAALPSSLFLAGIRRLGGIRAGIVMLAEPVVGVALAAAFLDEGLTALQVLGGATILGAAVLVERGLQQDVAAAVAPAPGGP